MAKLAVSDKVTVPVKFSMKDGKKNVNFAFTITCARLTSEDFQERTKGETVAETVQKIKATMSEITTGWEGQTFVLEDDGTPADFNEENLQLMYDATGVLDVVLKSYMHESAARAKN
jgi:hypothetical protein